jgi:hypothetical protein
VWAEKGCESVEQRPEAFGDTSSRRGFIDITKRATGKIMNYKEKLQSDLTQQEAIELGLTGWWKTMSVKEAALLQLNQPLLCTDTFSTFHGLVEEAIGKPVYNHQFADPQSLIERLTA